MTVIYEQHGFKILRHSRVPIQATVRIGKNLKYVFEGPLTLEEKVTDRYGKQCIIVIRMDKDKFPTLEQTDYEIEYPRIEICVPEEAARRMKLLR